MGPGEGKEACKEGREVGGGAEEGKIQGGGGAEAEEDLQDSGGKVGGTEDTSNAGPGTPASVNFCQC